MTSIETLIEGVEKLNISLTEDQLDEFKRYKELLLEWNQKINITAITDEKEVDIKHFLDSLTPNITKLFDGSKSIIDVGTGGGFPGLPLKILNKDLDVTLLDSLNKRIVFLKEVIDALNLEGVDAIHGRAEELSRTEEYRERYDVCISRAVASLDTLSEYCLPFVKEKGYFIAMKGPEVEEEVELSRKAIDKLGGKMVRVEKIGLPCSDIYHSLVVVKKIKKTPAKYPRGAGKPKKKPL